MADPQETETTQVATEDPVGPAAAGPKKRASRPGKGKAEAAQPAARNGARPKAKAAVPAARSGRRSYSDKERAQKLSQIEKSIAAGISKKNAVSQAGISEQTYYMWKRASASAPESDELKDLLALEQENKRLKSLLAERLRKENAELKKKLGLA